MKIRRQTALLVIIYLAFISLGLPDSVLGVAWPSIRIELGIPLEGMGVITTLLLIMSAFSSIVSTRALNKFGTAGVTFFSSALTALALLGYAFSASFVWLILFAIPLGLGQGAVDSGLNRYVAEHYSARHMNWLHCFWGLGASVGPLIMTRALLAKGWRTGYSVLSTVQLCLAAVFLVSILVGLWKSAEEQSSQANSEEKQRDIGLKAVSYQVMAVLLFFLYVGLECSAGYWLGSVLIESRATSVQIAGLAVTLLYLGIMAGRFLSGVIVNHLGNMQVVRGGIVLAFVGCFCIGLIHSTPGILAGTSMLGLGIAPIYPCLMHETPHRFIKGITEKLIGYQVGAACLGGSVLSVGTGLLLSRFSLELLFPILIALLIATFGINEVLYRKRKLLD